MAAALLLSAGCATDVSRLILVEPEPVPARVAFVVRDRTLFYGLAVTTCRGGRPVWIISNQAFDAPPSRIAYGVAPPGFATRVGPLPLAPGCYEVTVSGPSSARFRIGPDSTLVGDAAATARDSARPRPPS